MNRPIKFRVWVEAPDGEKAMHYPKLISFGSGQLSWATLQDDSVLKDNGWFTKREVMQYTGLKDKHGTDLFEGDLVKCGTLEGGPIGQIVWVNAKAQYEVCTKVTHLEHVTADHAKHFEVIGNVHQNPDLLK